MNDDGVSKEAKTDVIKKDLAGAKEAAADAIDRKKGRLVPRTATLRLRRTNAREKQKILLAVYLYNHDSTANAVNSGEWSLRNSPTAMATPFRLLPSLS
ncbi:unnamed protein product [Haemonchus placei]|uniref:MBF1 domain-containing protein n=1 Tax=Haemonchus placei TaxID=6290 RepID=A0A0N4X9Z0_HAEPC|nr:unnamed protein product [Haemonchus placei]